MNALASGAPDVRIDRHPGVHAARAPERPAVVMAGSGQIICYGEFEQRTVAIACLFRTRGLVAGDRIAWLIGNDEHFLAVVWAAQRAGLRYTPLPTGSTGSEIGYILEDCRASVVIASAELAESVDRGAAGRVAHWFCTGGDVSGWERLERAISDIDIGPVADECEGDCLLYSSGTTGRPKGVKRPLTLAPLGSGPDGGGLFLDRMGLGAGDVYLSTAPLYHGAALTWALSALRRGATVVVLEKFSTAAALDALERYAVTHSQWVPTMFVRMLKEAGAVDRLFPAHRAAAHGAAPCAIEVKQDMLGWWGPIVWEYYSCTEGTGATMIDPHEWMDRPGSVGRPVLGSLTIRDRDGEAVPPRAVGDVWFSGGYPFRYERDRSKTADSHNGLGEATVGDIGFVDEDGYLYLCDRRAHTVISGGVNVYPREIEDAIVTHQSVRDVAVVGVPDPDLGERLVAIVELSDPTLDHRQVAHDVIEHCRGRLARYKVPRRVVIVEAVPRSPAGKVNKRLAADLLDRRP